MPGMRRTYSKVDVADLVNRYHRTRDAALRDAIVEQMLPLVRSVARRFAGKEPVEDLESEGVVGLIRAVDQFSPERGAQFSTYATHVIVSHVRHYLRDRGHLIRQPAWLQELSSRVDRAAAELEQRLHREPTTSEIAASTNLTEEGVEELLAARQAAQTVRMETAAEEEDDYLLVDPEKIRSRSYVTLELPIEDRIVVENALGKLKELERKVLYYFYYQDFNQSEIARKLGISPNYTGRLLRNGLKNMREGLPREGSTERRASSAPQDASGAGNVDPGVMDAVTRLYTRDHFEQRLAEEISRSQRYKQDLALCCLRLPEDAVEETLATAAETLRRRVRRADVAGRTGPYELGVIFPHTGEPAFRVALHLAEQLQAETGSPVLAGAAVYPDHGRTAQELFAAARERPLATKRPAAKRAALQG